MATKTGWRIVPSFGFDALCFLNTLTGDGFYLEYNPDVYNHFAPLLTPEAKQALGELKRIVKDEGQHIISALLCLYFSAVEAHTLADLLANVTDSTAMLRGLQLSPYYDEQEWALYESVRPALKVIFGFLE